MVLVGMCHHNPIDAVRPVDLPDVGGHIGGGARIAAVHDMHPPIRADLKPDSNRISALRRMNRQKIDLVIIRHRLPSQRVYSLGATLPCQLSIDHCSLSVLHCFLWP